MPDRAWYYSSGGQQQGPVSTAQLKQLAASGEIQPSDLVWTDNMANWSPANTVKGLFSPSAPEAEAYKLAPATATAEVETAAASPNVQPAGDAQYSEQLQAAKEFARQASREAAGAFKSLMVDPVGGMGQSFRQFSNTTALQVGCAFLLTFVVLFIVAAFIGGASMPGLTMSADGAKEFFKGLIALLAMVAAMVGIATLFRTVTRSTGGIAADLFIVGASLLPIGLVVLLGSVLNQGSRVVAALLMALLVFAITFSTLMLYSGFTQILRLPERIASLAVPSVFVAGGAAVSLIAWLFG